MQTNIRDIAFGTAWKVPKGYQRNNLDDVLVRFLKVLDDLHHAFGNVYAV